MALKNYQYNTILREYDNRRLQNQHELKKRKEEVYAKIPELTLIDQEIIDGSIQSAKLSLSGDETALNHLK